MTMPDNSTPQSPASWNVGDTVSATINPAYFTTGVVAKVTDTTIEIQWDNFAYSIFDLTDPTLQSVTNTTTNNTTTS